MIKLGKKGRGIYGILLFSLLFVIGGIAYILSEPFHQELRAQSSEAPSLQLYDKITVAKHTYSVIEDTDEYVKLLNDSYISNAYKNWSPANTQARGFATNGNVGVLGVQVLTDQFSLPLLSDLSLVTDMENHVLQSGIPTLDRQWWLGDPSLNNRSKVIAANTNSTIPNEFIWYSASIGPSGGKPALNNTCVSETHREYDGIPTEAFVANEEIKGDVITETNFAITRDYLGNLHATWYTDIACSAGKYTIGNTAGSDHNIYYFNGQYSTNHRHEVAAIAVAKGWKPKKVGDTYKITIQPDVCYNVSSVPSQYEGQKKYKSVKYNSYKTTQDTSDQSNRSLPYEYTLTVTYSQGDVGKIRTCPARIVAAGNGTVRPMLVLPKDKIALLKSEKRNFEPSSRLEDVFESDTDINAYHTTLYNDEMDIQLNPNADGVSGTTLYTKINADGLISIPVKLTGSKEGTKYVSASAMINGVEKFGVLKSITGNEGVVELDANQFGDDLSTLTTIPLTLYHEDSGTYDTTYISKGTQITIQLPESQTIAFDEGQNTTAIYGDTVTLTSHLTSSVAGQAASDITYSIKSGPAAIASQSYNATAGTAQATLSITGASGEVVVAINKTGNDDIGSATEVTFTLTLAKKPITVKPTAFDHIYAIGEQMPALQSATEGLIEGDFLPAELLPVLQPLDGAVARPDTDGKISAVGKWKLVYPEQILDSLTSFTDLYDVTLEDWDNDNTLILETGISTIPDGWVLVSPDANEKGWNHEAVVISLHEDAVNAGYTTIEVVDDTGAILKSGSTITYDNDTTALNLKVRLKKGAYTSSPLSLRTIKIDQTAPSVSASVGQEAEWANKKTITIHASDAGSTIDTVKITDPEGTEHPLTAVDGSYAFDAEGNGTYTIQVLDQAGNETIITKELTMIDGSEVTLTAVKEVLTAEQPTQDITLTYSAGTSGIKSFKVYHKTAEGTYTELETITPESSPLIWTAEMNGWFKFELKNNAGTSATAEVEITQINPPKPVTAIQAVYVDEPDQAYTTNTWTNKNVQLTISNANEEVGEPVTFLYSEDNGTTWAPLGENPLIVSTDTLIEKNYLFKGTSTHGGETVEESSGKSFIVKIDKAKPEAPSILNHDRYTDEHWYAEGVKVETEITPKANEIQQFVYACVGSEAQCNASSAQWVKTRDGAMEFSANNTYEVYFKVIDEAGNESEISGPAIVNINNGAPTITISIKNNPIKDLINDLTFGFFFKETVDIDISADFGTGQNGTIYYIIDQNDLGNPEESSDQWVEGTHTSLSPQAKAMIYVKAVSDAGISARADSVFHVYADSEAPVITMPDDQDTWTSTNELSVQIEDTLSGIATDSLKVQIDTDPEQQFSLQNGAAQFTNLKNGSYTIQVKASDHSGNDAIGTVNVMIDKELPTITDVAINPVDWSKEKEVSFTAMDSVSGIDRVEVTTHDGRKLDVTDQGNGVYAFSADESSIYTIAAFDHAGNKKMIPKIINTIDVTPPFITNQTIDHEDEWQSSKTVHFDVTDSESGVDQITVTYLENGETKQAAVLIPETGATYSFTAKVAGEYTITATDHAGNSSTAKVQVDKLEESNLSIEILTDLSTWTKDTKQVHFRVDAGNIGIASGYPIVTRGSEPLTVAPQEDGIYAFTADRNGMYQIEAKNEAGDQEAEPVQITRIDTLAPVIHTISDNTTSDQWREPQTITFHVSDYNDSAKATTGSGMKQGYPSVYYMDGSTKVAVPVQKGTDDAYTFTADQNTTYIVEAMDAVEHDPVTASIPVDHIQTDDMFTELVVIAENKGSRIVSGAWVNGDLTFTLSGGLKQELLEGYKVAVTDGEQPDESLFEAINHPDTKQHILTGNVNRTYWFRAVPISDGTTVSQPFVVHLDNAKPTDVAIIRSEVNTSFLASLINTLSFGAWMKEAQEITFEAVDNFTPPDQMRYMYAEERNGEIGPWKVYQGDLIYEDADIILHVKAIDLAENPSDEIVEPLQIDTTAPRIEGVKDQSVYKQYYLPRFISIVELESGLAEAYYTKNNGEQLLITDEVKIYEEGTYRVYAKDNVGNEAVLTFKIVQLPDIETEIDGSDESKEIIDQIQKELEENKEKLDPNETANYEEWIQDAQDKWDSERKKVIETEDKTAKVEGQGDTTFDPNTELIVAELPETDLPPLPRKALNAFDVYMKKGNTIIQPDGTVKVYLPYTEEEPPIVYQINEDGTITELKVEVEGDQITFITDQLKKYAITNAKQEANGQDDQCVLGPDGQPGTGDETCAKPDENGTPPSKDDDGNVHVPPGGGIVFPGGNELDTPDGGIIHPDGSVTLPDGSEYNPDGTKKDPNTCNIEGTSINVDTDNDHLPDLNLDTDGDCQADLNIDLNHDRIPDLNIDTTGDGKPNINIDPNGSGKAQINLVLKIPAWEPNYNTNVDGFAYDTMVGIQPDLNVDEDGDGKPDRNVDTDGDGKPDQNVDDDWFEKHGMNKTDPSQAQKYDGSSVGGASTGDGSKWVIWWTMMLITVGSMITLSVKKRLKHKK